MIGWAIDPAIGLIVRLSLSLLFVWTAGHKLRDLAGFRSTLANYAMLPTRWIAPCAVALTALETAVATGLWWPRVQTVSSLVAAGLLALYAAAIVVNLARGRRDIACGCAGGAGDRPISGALVLRNGMLLLAVGISVCPAASRPLTWLDVLTIPAGVSALVLLYAAIDSLLANAPALAVLIGTPRERATMRLPAEEGHA